MVLHRSLGNAHSIRDLAIAVTGNHESQDFSFTLGEWVWRIEARKVWLCLLQPSQYPLGDDWFDQGSARFECRDRLGELIKSTPERTHRNKHKSKRTFRNYWQKNHRRHSENEWTQINHNHHNDHSCIGGPGSQPRHSAGSASSNAD